jgi:hypothetical protein
MDRFRTVSSACRAAITFRAAAVSKRFFSGTSRKSASTISIDFLYDRIVSMESSRVDLK